LSGDPDGAPLIGPRELFAAFFWIGVQGFGGVLPWAKRELVEKRRWLTQDEFIDYWSICQPLPGGNIMNVAIAFGTRCAGAAGALAAFTGLVFAPFIIIIALGYIYTTYGHRPEIGPTFRGIAAAGAGMLVATACQLAMTPRLRSPLALFAVASFLLTVWLKWPLLAVMGTLVPFSLALAWRRRR
jgi:chromate transporter